MKSLRSIPVQKIPGVGAKKKKQLEKLNINTVYDILLNIPRDYIDFSTVHNLAEPRDSKGIYKVEVIAPPVVRQTRGAMKILTIDVRDSSGAAQLIYFNQEFLKKRFNVGSVLYLYGNVERTAYGPQMSSPEIIRPTDIGRYKAVYTLTDGLYESEISRFTALAFNRYKEEIIDYLPQTILDQLNLYTLRRAIRGVHYPENHTELYNSLKRLSFDELFKLKHNAITKDIPDCQYPNITEDAISKVNKFIADLPFELTGAQQRSIDEIIKDMTSDKSMNRLLQGDVGSGKTVVAAAALLLAIEGGYQGAFMAPTEILATQQYESFIEDFKDWDINIQLLTGDTSVKSKRQIYEDLESGKIDLIVGTHALIQPDVKYKNLGISIIDEQHRFGVQQRQDLVDKGGNPHNLVMTATPIPRTLAMVLYGDMDVSVIDELPPMRKPVQTVVINQSYQNRLDNFVIDQVSKNKQVFIVCPLIEDENETGLNSLEEILEYYNSPKFEGLTVQSVHGQDSSDIKNTIMDDFAAGEIDVLVSTTVVEVGINVPNASLMIIYDADRFGLSQLHQLRGRVGRGSDKAYCVLINNNDSQKAFDRMSVMKESEDGFYIAEKDLELRGEGDLEGLRQHGVPSLRVANLIKDGDIIELINKNYEKIIESIAENDKCKRVFEDYLEQ